MQTQKILQNNLMLLQESKSDSNHEEGEIALFEALVCLYSTQEDAVKMPL